MIDILSLLQLISLGWVGLDLVPLIDGDTLIAPLVFRDFAPGSKEMTLIIDAGPELSVYPPFRLTFRSVCEQDMYFPGGTSMEYERTGNSLDIPVEWLAPCPPVEFAATLVEEGTFTVNEEMTKGDWLGQHKNQLRVVAVNKHVIDQSWRTDPRLTSVVLEYRKTGTSVWREAQLRWQRRQRLYLRRGV